MVVTKLSDTWISLQEAVSFKGEIDGNEAFGHTEEKVLNFVYSTREGNIWTKS